MAKITSFFIGKILGFGLVIAGVTIIIWGIYASFGIFLYNQPPPQIFEVEVDEAEEEKINQKQPLPENEEVPLIGEVPLVGEMPLVEVDAIIQDIVADMIPPGTVPTILNLMVWSLFMAIVFMGGARLAMIGVQLISIKNGGASKK
jgi:hypothetical protein